MTEKELNKEYQKILSFIEELRDGFSEYTVLKKEKNIQAKIIAYFNTLQNKFKDYAAWNKESNIQEKQERERKKQQAKLEKGTNTPYHEAGHAVYGLLHEDFIYVTKATIKETKKTLGSVIYDFVNVEKINNDDRWHLQFLQVDLNMALAGCCAEEIIVGDTAKVGGITIKEAFFEYQGDFKYFKKKFSEMYLLKEKIKQSPKYEALSQQDSFLLKKSLSEWKAIVEPLWQETKNFLEKHEDLLEMIAKQLRKQTTLHREELQNLKNQYLDSLKEPVEPVHQPEHPTMPWEQWTTLQTKLQAFISTSLYQQNLKNRIKDLKEELLKDNEDKKKLLKKQQQELKTLQNSNWQFANDFKKLLESK